MMRLPGVSPIRSCSRVKDSVSPPGSAARVATIFSRVGTWISGSRVSSVMAGHAAVLAAGDGGGLAQQHGAQADAGDGPGPGGPSERARDAGDGEREAYGGPAPAFPPRLDGSPGQAGDDQDGGGVGGE